VAQRHQARAIYVRIFHFGQMRFSRKVHRTNKGGTKQAKNLVFNTMIEVEEQIR